MSDSNRTTSRDELLSTLSAESKVERVDRMSLNPQPLKLSESLSARPESESKPHSESKVPTQEYLREEARPEHLAEEERAPVPLAKGTLSLLSTLQKEWTNVSASAALADRLYVVESGHLFEVNPKDGSRRVVGTDDWPNAGAMGTAGGQLYIVNDNQLFEVDPKSGTRRTLGKPDWTDTQAIQTFGDKLYIASRGMLYRVDPKDGSREVLPSKTESLNQSPEPKP
jgi:hypothetical protein